MRRSVAALWPHLKSSVPGFKYAPSVADFEVTAEEAKQRFISHQKRSILAPNNVLGPDHQIQPLLLPFWLFHVNTAVQYSARVSNTASDGSTHWRTASLRSLQHGEQDYSNNLLGAQVCAAYTYRRDYIAAIKPDNQSALLRPLTRNELEAGVSRDKVLGDIPLSTPDMRQAIAWEFALRGIRDQEAAGVVGRFKTEFKAEEVTDIRVKLKPRLREAQLAYFPVYQLTYTYGETFNVHGERKPQHFVALISGLKAGGLAAERHFSARKASVLAGTGFAAALGGVNVLLGTHPTHLLTIDNGFLMFLAGSAAALSTRVLPLLYQQHVEDQRISLENSEYERIVSLGMGPMDAGSDEQEAIRSDVEWRRWEQSDLGAWNPEKRQQWAEALWKSQHQRRLERIHLKQRLQREEARREQEEDREHRRRKRWGHSSHHHSFKHNLGSSGMRPGLYRDPLGYYKVLGLDVSKGTISQTAIKKAFRQLALRWHPDTHMDDGKKRHAKETFHLIKTAYDCLSDPKQREMYDRGEVIRGT